MTPDFDVLIAGGGLVGGSLALALRATGLRLGIVESQGDAERLSAAAGERALALSWGSSQILGQLDVWREAVSQAAPIMAIHVSDRGRFGKVRMRASRVGAPVLGYVVRARVLEKAIAGALAQTAVTQICPARVVGVKAGSDAVHVSILRGKDSQTLSARLLVAADGGFSTVRSLLEIEQQVRDYRQTAIVTEVETERHHQDVAYERFTASGPLAFLPLGKKRCSVVWSLEPQEAQELQAVSAGEFVARLEDAFGHWLGGLALAAGRQCFPLKLIHAVRMVDERVVLVGNAMHQLHPVAGQGFNLGLRDVAVLADRLIAQHGFGADVGARDFLHRYAAARQTDLMRVIRLTDGLVRLFSTDEAWMGRARSLGLLLFDALPFAKRWLMNHAMGRAQAIPRLDG